MEKMPTSREGKKPLPFTALARDGMYGLCKTCAYASDTCTDIRKQADRAGITTYCNGYAEIRK